MLNVENLFEGMHKNEQKWKKKKKKGSVFIQNLSYGEKKLPLEIFFFSFWFFFLISNI